MYRELKKMYTGEELTKTLIGVNTPLWIHWDKIQLVNTKIHRIAMNISTKSAWEINEFIFATTNMVPGIPS